MRIVFLCVFWALLSLANCDVPSKQSNLFSDIAKALLQYLGKGDNPGAVFSVTNIVRDLANQTRRKEEGFQGGKSFLEKTVIKTKAPKEGAEKRRRTPELGAKCSTNEECQRGVGLFCSSKHRCQCNPSFVQVNATHCLPGVLLGFRCEEHSQCRLRVKDSSCIQGYCRCGAGTVPYRRANCLQGAELDEKCRTNTQCLMGTEGSYCKWIVKNVLGKCQCSPEMPRRGDRCGPLGYALGAPCGKSLDCAQHVVGSVCATRTDVKENDLKDDLKKISTKVEESRSIFDGVCRCPKGFIAIQNGTRCVSLSKEVGVSAVSLGKQCHYSSQCLASDPHSYCKDGICTCYVDTPECSPKNTGCFNGTFQCHTNGRCISADYVCNGRRECPDGSDELECVPGSCSSLAFTCRDGSCVSRSKICDGRADCADGSDESGCVGAKDCPLTAFRCRDGRCLPGYTFCNAEISCKDGSDEDHAACIGGLLRVATCPFRCNNMRCRSASVMCSGKDGCGDNSDEEKCSVCNCPKQR